MATAVWATLNHNNSWDLDSVIKWQQSWFCWPGRGRANDQKITWLAGWLHRSHIATVLCWSHPRFSFHDYRAGPKSRHWALINSDMLGAAPSSLLLFALLWIPSPDWLRSLHFESLLTFPLPCFSWQVSDWSSLDMHQRGGEEDVWRPSDPGESIQGCIPLHPLVPLLPHLPLLQQWGANSLMSCLLP